MKTTINHPAKLNVKVSQSNGRRTLINSLSPNFFYVNKSGGTVHPEQCCLY